MASLGLRPYLARVASSLRGVVLVCLNCSHASLGLDNGVPFALDVCEEGMSAWFSLRWGCGGEVPSRGFSRQRRAYSPEEAMVAVWVLGLTMSRAVVDQNVFNTQVPI